MPKTDPPAEAHHLRLEVDNLDECLEVFKDMSNCAAVRHEGGKGGEHPHLHIWVQYDTPVTAQTVRNRLKKFPAFAAVKGNGDWSIRSHNAFDVWINYCMKDTGAKQPRVVVWNRVEQFPVVIPVTVIEFDKGNPRPKATVKTQYEMVSDIMDIVNINSDSKKFEFDKVYEATSEVLRQNKKGGDIYYVMKIMEMVAMYFYPDDHHSMVKTAWNFRHRL